MQGYARVCKGIKAAMLAFTPLASRGLRLKENDTVIKDLQSLKVSKSGSQKNQRSQWVHIGTQSLGPLPSGSSTGSTGLQGVARKFSPLFGLPLPIPFSWSCLQKPKAKSLIDLPNVPRHILHRCASFA